MAANIPAKLKGAGITSFVTKAAQLEKAKPVIAYWCMSEICEMLEARR
jgi:vacuolar protein sorting-associated protein VTA1